MIVTYATIELASGYNLSEDTLGNGGMPEGEQQGIQISRPIGAEWSIIRPRGQRLNTIQIITTPPPFEDIGTSMVEALVFFNSLPQSGALEIIQQGQGAVFANAVLKSYKPSLRGVSNEYQFTFLAGAPSSARRYLTDASGNLITDHLGGYLTL